MYLSFVTYASNPLLYNCKTYDISDFALESFKIKSDLLFSKTFFDESRSTLLRLRFGYRQYLHLSVSVNLMWNKAIRTYWIKNKPIVFKKFLTKEGIFRRAFFSNMTRSLNVAHCKLTCGVFFVFWCERVTLSKRLKLVENL